MVHGSVRLNFPRALMKTWLGTDVAVSCCILLDLDSPSPVRPESVDENEVVSALITLLCTRQRTHVIHQSPYVIRRLSFAETRHSREPDAIVDDPKQFFIRVALYSLTGEIRGAWVHPLSRRRLRPAIHAVAYAAIQAVMRASRFNTGSSIHWRSRNAVAAGEANDNVFGQIRYACFKRTRLLQRRQTEMHHSNSDQHRTRHQHCPKDSRPHEVLFR